MCDYRCIFSNLAVFVIFSPFLYGLFSLFFSSCYFFITCTLNPSSYYNTKSVFLALGITVIVCIAVTVFCFQTKVTCKKKKKNTNDMNFVCRQIHICFIAEIWAHLQLTFPSGGFHQMRRSFLRPGNRCLRDWNHHRNRTVI